MYPSIDELVAYVQIVESGSISAAARKLDLAKSVVSARLAALEARLGVTLLRRTTRRMALTDAGRLFATEAGEILLKLEEASLEAATTSGADGRLRGMLRITAPLSFGAAHLGTLLMPFLNRNPQLQCRIDLDDRAVDLLEGKFDLAIRIGRLPDSSLIARRVGESRRIVCCSPAYLERMGEPRHPDDLHHHEFIGYANSSAANLWTLCCPDGATITAAAPRPRIVANNGEVIRDAAIAGLGLAVLPRFIVEAALGDGKLLPVMTAFEPVPEAIQLVYTQERQLSLKSRALIDYLVAAFAEHDW